MTMTRQEATRRDNLLLLVALVCALCVVMVVGQ
jgi:hypothetical protein